MVDTTFMDVLLSMSGGFLARSIVDCGEDHR
jgi:hypothetical protein